jgi:uncharacterized membrane protein
VYLPFFGPNEISISLDLIINLFAPDFVIADHALNFFTLAPGAFIALGMILAFMQGRKVKRVNKEIEAQKRLIEEKKKAALLKKAKALEVKEAL